MTTRPRRSRVPTRVLLLAALTPLAAAAQQAEPEYFPTPTLGIRSGYAFTQEAPIVGLASSVPLDRRFEVILGGDLVLEGVDERWRVGADLVLRLGRVGEYYAGAGATMSDFEQEGNVRRRTALGFSLVGGYEMGRARAWSLRPFIEPRWAIIDDRSFFTLGVGINYALEKPF